MRTAIIYANWRVPFEKLKSVVWENFGTEIRSIVVGALEQIFIFEQIALFFLLFAFSKYFYSGYVSLDFFDPDFQLGYKVLNLTYLEMLENSAMLICFYVLRYARLTEELPG